MVDGNIRGWREPTLRLPLRWGSYRLRYAAGLGLAIAGGLLVQVTSAYSLAVLPTGLLLHVVGWCILPGAGWRRVTAAATSALATIFLLNGASSVMFLAVPLGGWLLVRQRPIFSYPVLVLPVIAAALLSPSFSQYGYGALVLAVGLVVIVAAAWIARSLTGIMGVSANRLG